MHSLRHSLLRKIIKKYFKNEEEPCLICLKSIAVQNPTHKNRFLGIWSLCNTYILHLYLVRYIFKKLYLCIIWHLLTQLIKIFKTGFFEGSRHIISLLSNTLYSYVAMEIFQWGGEVQKIFGGDVVGDPNVQSTIRERNFFLFFF